MNALVTPSVRQIIAQVDVVLRQDADAQAIGIRAQGDGAWPPQIRIGERDFSVAWCPSPITVREQLVGITSLPNQGEIRPGVVIMTPLSDQAVGADVLARLSRGRIFSIEAWDMVRHAFQAKDIDSRLARWPWVAEALMENLPPSGYPPARGGLLDVETAWSHVLRAVLGLATESTGRPDLPSLLRWSLSPQPALRYADLSEKARHQIQDWLVDSLGASGKLVSQILEAGFGGELMPIALACGMILRPTSGPTDTVPPHPELLAAGVRLERYTGGQPVPMREGLRLHAAAVQVAASMDASSLMPILDVADRMIESLHLLKFAHVSDDLPSGFNARLVLFGESVESFLGLLRDKDAAKRNSALGEVLTTGRRVLTHRLAVHHGLRVSRLKMAMRLIQRLADSAESVVTNGTGIAGLVKDYSAHGAYMDWARLSLLGGDELAAVSRAYAALREAIRERRDEQNRLFAQALASWNAGGAAQLSGLKPVEKIVSDVVAPVAAKFPVLVLLVDGLSLPIFRELVEDAQRQGWCEVFPEAQEESLYGLATIPSVTEISRCSLFCGSVIQGQAANEKTGFAQHPALLPLIPSNRTNAKPVLFHKADLTSGTEGSSLSDVVRDAISARERRVVGVVFNGVDDHLSGSDQLHPHWTLDDLRLIKPLLYEARNAGRLVLITADHGHVIDEATHTLPLSEKSGSTGNEVSNGDRWRSAAGGQNIPTAEEIALSGGRVKTPSLQTNVVVPWSESLRYGSRKNGYHGGVSLQEMVVPIAWMVPSSSVPEGFRIAPTVTPDWWEVSIMDTPVATATQTVAPARNIPKKSKLAPTADEMQQTLFEAQVIPATSAEMQVVGTSIWIDELLQSSVFQAQKQWVARAAIKDEEVRRLLEALAERGGRLSKAALAVRLGFPAMRVSGFVNSARRLLNVDQSPVLVLDESEGFVALNRSLLDVQFQLTKGRRQ